MIRPACLLTLVVLLSDAGRAVAHAEGQVALAVAGEVADAERLAHSLQEAIEQRQLAFSWERVGHIDPRDVARAAQPDGPLARVHAELTTRPATLYFVDERAGRIFKRVLDIKTPLDRVGVELVRLVVETSLDALLAGQSPGMSRDEFAGELAATPPAPPSAPNAVAPPAPDVIAPDSQRRWLLAGGYAGTMLLADTVAHGAELLCELRLARLHLLVEVGASLPWKVSRAGVEATQVTVVGRTLALLPVALSPRTILVGGAGVALESIRTRPKAVAPGLQAAPVSWAIAPLVVAAFGIEHQLGRLLVGLHAGAGIDVRGSRYVIQQPGGTRALWQPWRVRPFVMGLIGTIF